MAGKETTPASDRGNLRFLGLLSDPTLARDISIAALAVHQWKITEAVAEQTTAFSTTYDFVAAAVVWGALVFGLPIVLLNAARRIKREPRLLLILPALALALVALKTVEVERRDLVCDRSSRDALTGREIQVCR